MKSIDSNLLILKLPDISSEAREFSEAIHQIWKETRDSVLMCKLEDIEEDSLEILELDPLLAAHPLLIVNKNYC